MVDHLCLRLAAALLCLCSVNTLAQTRVIPQDQLRSGSTYMSADHRATQADDFANPGMLWVEKGAKLWSTPAGTQQGTQQRACASCHGDARTTMKGAATRYPAFDSKTKKLLNLDGRINQCRTERQGAPAFAPESEEALSISAYVAHQSRGMPLNVSIGADAQPHFERGQTLYQRRIGQMNLACMHCHEWNAGKRLLAENISQGHPNAYPVYRLEWQSAGSLHRRLRACYFGVRAEMPPYGAQDLLDLELFLAWRAQGLTLETPGVRR
jgi:L-cysteine S-thiosulfotransferase